MISIREWGGIFHPGRVEGRRIVLFRFYCDESYDGKAENPDYFTISGFLSDQPTWEEVEDEWTAIHRKYGVSHFHATKLNRRDGEYEGWCKSKGCEYSAELLHSINRQEKRMVAYNCGVRGDAYRRIISPVGQIRMGHPWIMCFQSCLAMVAGHMETLSTSDSFAVVLGRESRFDALAVDAFNRMAENPMFPYAHRLATCASGNPEKIIGLQVADLMAFEYYKRMRQQIDGDPMPIPRTPLALIQQHNNYAEGFFGESWFAANKQMIESTPAGPNQLVVMPKL